MDSDTRYKIRSSLRSIQSHVIQVHLNLGVRRESLGLVDVFYHPHIVLPRLNFVAPRRSTAWVPAQPLQAGLDRLRELERTPRVYYFESLFPPVFARSLRQLGLEPESEASLMIHQIDLSQPPAMPPMPPDMMLELPTDLTGESVWWEVWRSSLYQVIVQGIEPVFIGYNLGGLTRGDQLDLILYRYDFPLAVARLSFYQQSAHLSAAAIRQQAHTSANLKLLFQLLTHYAGAHGASLIFTSPCDDIDRRAAREAGFVDSGTIVCYAEQSRKQQQYEEFTSDYVAESIFVLR